MEHPDKQESEMTLPLSNLRSGAGGFLQWMFHLTNKRPPEEMAAMQNALMTIHNRWIMAIDDYRFPVVTLSGQTKPDALCTIFETLNRTGVKLSVFELLTARFWPKSINLRALWETALGQNPIISEFDIDPYYLLQAIALASRKAPSCKRGDVLNLAASDIEKWWQPVVTGLVTGLHILRDDCKVTLPKWIPYQTMLSPLAAVLARKGKLNTPLAGAHREKLKRWFWCAVFSQAYESSPNSQAAKDVVEMDQWLEGGEQPETVHAAKFDPRALRDVTPRQRAIYRGTICLVLGSGAGARDFHTQAVISGQLMQEEGIDDHHVFPDNFLQKHKGIAVSRTRDCVLNRTLIDRTTNQIISDRAPSSYLAEIRATDGFPFDLVVSSHCLPVGADSPLLTDDYESFLTWRQDRIWAEIKRVTGIAEAANLEAV